MEKVTFSLNWKLDVFMTHWEKWVHFIRPLRPDFVKVTSWRNTPCLFDFFVSVFPNLSQKCEYKSMSPNCYRLFTYFSFFVFFFPPFYPSGCKKFTHMFCFVFFLFLNIYIFTYKKGMDRGHLEKEIIDTKPLVLYNFDANNCKSICTVNWCETS